MIDLVPESGQHLVFLTLYIQGVVPFSLLLASSIVQHGHGMLPLLAELRLDFLKIKGINFVVGLVSGSFGYLWGWQWDGVFRKNGMDVHRHQCHADCD